MRVPPPSAARHNPAELRSSTSTLINRLKSAQQIHKKSQRTFLLTTHFSPHTMPVPGSTPNFSSTNEQTGRGEQRRAVLKGEGLTKTGAGNLLAAIIFAAVTCGAASAQDGIVRTFKGQPTEPFKGQPTQQQSTSQIVGDQKPLEPKSSATQKPAAQPKLADSQPEADAQTVVVPPAPVITKKDSHVILIPADGAVPDSKYKERPAVSSSVSVGSSFGYRRDPFTRRAKFHSGVDIKARWGDPVGASQAGTVTFAGWYHGYGNMIIVNHGGGVATHYAHLSSFDVEVGARVERGTVIGRAGSTGRATSPHLHYEVRIDGNPMNPFQPLALDPSSDYFKQTRPTVDAGRGDATAAAGPQQNN